MARCVTCGFDAASELDFCPRCGTSLRDRLVGALLGGRYRILSRIGAGGMGAVYRALHTSLKREVAVKVLLPDFGGKEEFVRRFEREAESASRLAHPNIIAVTDFGRTDEELLFLVMELLDGPSLASLIARGPIAVPRALAIVRQLLAGLGHAHSAGVVHRDLKPDNIMLVEREGRTEVVKILDFGIAKITDAAAGGEALTQAGVIFGTPEYLSPEQALGDTVDARADLYAAGVILFEMLTARRPFESEEKVRIISMHLSHPPPRLAEVNPTVRIPAALEDVVMQALEKQREHRFSSAAAFQAALDESESESDADADAPAPAAAAAAAAASARDGLAAPPSKESSVSGLGAVSRHRRITPARAAGAVVVLGLTLAAIVLLPRHGSRSGTVATSPVTRPAPPPAELGKSIALIEGLLGSGDVARARVALEQVLADHPSSARVRYMLGRVAFAEDRHSEALGNYREAIALDPGFRGDPVVIEHLGVALFEPKVADQALELATERVGRPATELLVRVANGSGDVHRRRRAAEALAELGEDARVDKIGLQMAELKRATTCEERKPIVVKLGKAGDPRALPALRAQRSRGGFERLFGGGDSNNTCMKTELADAIALLEGKLPPDKRPAAHAPPRRATSSRSSLFRGR